MDTVPLTLLDHRGESLEAESTFPDRLVQVFSLRGAKVFGAAAKLRSEDGINFLTVPEGPRGENANLYDFISTLQFLLVFSSSQIRCIF